MYPLPRFKFHSGFTILELLAAITISALLLAVTVPASARFYASIQYRQAIRDVIATLSSARYKAVNSGLAQDVAIDPHEGRVFYNGGGTELPSGLQIAVHSAGELNQEGARGVIRFYPEGGSSGGGVDLRRPDGTGVKISVDWLMGGVSHAPYVFD